MKTPIPIGYLGGGGGGGGGGFPPSDWAASGTTAFVNADYPDLAVADGGLAAASVATFGGGAGLRFATANSSTLVGRKLFDIPAGDFVRNVRMRVTLDGIDWNTSAYGGAFVAFWDGTDTSADAFYAVGPMRRSQDADSGGLTRINGTGRPALTSVSASVQAVSLGESVDYFVRRVGTTLALYANGMQVDTWTVGAGAATVGAIAAENDAGVTIFAEITALGEASTVPPLADD